MKHSLALLAMTVLTGALSLCQTGCTGYYASGPAPVYYGSSPVIAWGGAGYYGGTYYRSSSAYYGSPYYRGGGVAYRTPYSNGGYYNGARGSASWHNGSGSANGWRGGSASWNDGSGSANGWRGGSASWGGGSGSWHGSRGGSGSWHR
ncbi:MAG: hypothetical protein NTV93_19295 [Verrucomicrobia bacterium]|nr:hypothetical protein [Verrucomicrobiota bacterium]